MVEPIGGEGNQGDTAVASGRFLWLLCALGLSWRLVIAARTPLPSEDGVNYLWMAERFAQLDARAALSEVFPPLLPLLTALPVKLGIDPFRAAQLVLCACGAAALPFL